MDSENRYLTRSDLNVDNLLREKKMAKIMIFFASLGVFAGISASITFFFHFKLAATPLFALISAFFAIFVIYIHIEFLRDYWQIWTYQLKYWYYASFVFQIVFVFGFFVLIILAIYERQTLTVDSYYVSSVWMFMSWKWAFALFYRTKKYRVMFTRYSLIGVDGDQSDFNSE